MESVSRKVKIEKYKSMFVNENTNNNANYDSDDLMYGATVLELLPRNSNNKNRLRANPALMKTGPYAQINKTGNKTLINPWFKIVNSNELENKLKPCTCNKTFEVGLIKCPCKNFLDVSLFECSSESSSTCDNSTIDEYRKIRARPAMATPPGGPHPGDRTERVGVISRSNQCYGVQSNPPYTSIDDPEPATRGNLEKADYVKFFVDVVSKRGEDSIKVINLRYDAQDDNGNNSNNNNNSQTTISSSTTQSSDTTTSNEINKNNKNNKNNNNYDDSDDSAESMQQKFIDQNKLIYSNCKDSDSDISKNKKVMKMDSETYKQFKMFLKQREMDSVNNDLKKSQVQKLKATPAGNNPNNAQSASIGNNNIEIRLKPEVALRHQKDGNLTAYLHDRLVTETVKNPNWMNERLVSCQTHPGKMDSQSDATYGKRIVHGLSATPTESPRNKPNSDYGKTKVSNLSAAAVQISSSKNKQDPDYRKMKASELSAASRSAHRSHKETESYRIVSDKNVGVNAEPDKMKSPRKNTPSKSASTKSSNNDHDDDEDKNDKDNDDDDTISLDATLKLRIYEDENGNLVTDNKAKLVGIPDDDDLGLSKKTSAVHLSVSTEAMGKRSQTEIVVPICGDRFSQDDEIRLNNRNFIQGHRHAWTRETNTNENNNVMIETEKKAIVAGMIDKNYYYMEKCEKTSVTYSTDSSTTSVSNCINSEVYRAKNEESDVQSMSTSSNVTLVASSNEIVASTNYKKMYKNKNNDGGNVRRLVDKHQQTITTEDSTTTIDDERNVKPRSKSKLSALKRFTEKNGKKLLGKKEIATKNATTGCAKHAEVSDSQSEDIIEGYERWQLEELEREEERQRLRKSLQLKEKRRSKQ